VRYLSYYRLTQLSLILGSIFLLTGCQITEKELARLPAEKKGYWKLASYVVDQNRPIKSRWKALGLLTLPPSPLIEDEPSGFLGNLFGESNDERNAKKPKQRDPLAGSERFSVLLSIFQSKEVKPDVILEIKKQLAQILAVHFGPNTTSEQKEQAADTAFYVMENQGFREILMKNQDLVKAMTRWALNSIYPAKKINHLIDPKIFLKVLLKYGQDTSLNELKNYFEMGGYTQDRIIAIYPPVHSLGDITVNTFFANLMLKTAKKNYPALKQGLVEEMIRNENETLLKYLIEVVRDNQAPLSIQRIALNRATETFANESMPYIKRLLQSTSVEPELFFSAFEKGLKYGGISEFGTLIKAINPEFEKPLVDTSLRLATHQICKMIRPYKPKIQDFLIDLLDEMEDSPTYWYGRLTVAYCIQYIYPDEGKQILRKRQKYFAKDTRAVVAWQSGKTLLLRDIITQLLQ
jgi:hypothetical protein